MQGGNDKPGRCAQDKGSSEENEYVPSDIKRVTSKSVGSRRDEVLLCLEHDNPHAPLVKIIGCPEPQQKTRDQ